MANNSLRCWGSTGTIGGLGNGITPSIPYPTEIANGGVWADVQVGTSHTCGIKPDGTLHCWGLNSDSQLGDGTTIQRDVPTAVSGGGTWKQVSLSAYHSCGIKSDDTIWCWGPNFNGQLGDNTTTARSTPVALSGGGTWKSVNVSSDATYAHSCGIKSDDTLWCWGNNSAGQLGDNTTTQRLIPTAISGGGTWKHVETGGNRYSCGIKSDDTLWCWGFNQSSQLGDGTTTQRNVPTAIGGASTWKAVSLETQVSCGIKTNNSMWCWGFLFGTVPATLSGGGTWKSISKGQSNLCGLQTNDTFWCWDLAGALTASAPSATWKTVNKSNGHTCGISTSGALLCWGANGNNQCTISALAYAYSVTGVQPLCGAPTGKPGKIVFNSASNTLQYCNGDGWLGFGGFNAVPTGP